jgi:Fur family transcriptional regulator, ferric uptake regulator
VSSLRTTSAGSTLQNVGLAVIYDQKTRYLHLIEKPMSQIGKDNLEAAKKILTAYLENKGLRKTPERFAILEEIYTRSDHFDVDELYISMKNKKYRVSRATVYNTLDVLVDCDLVTKHQFGKNLAQYEKSYGFKQHDHLICTDCHKVMEFCDPRIQSIQNMVGEMLHFKVDHHSLIFYGGCTRPNCENRKDIPEEEVLDQNNTN